MVIGFRNKDVGSDTHNYYRIFNVVNQDNGLAAWGGDFLYANFNRFVGSWNGTPETVIFLCAFITIGTIAYVIYRYSPSLLLSLSLLYAFGTFAQCFNGIRQLMAAAIVFYSIKFIINSKLAYFVITIFIAAGFHITAIIFLPVYFLPKVKLSWIHLSIAWLASFTFVIKKDMMSLIVGKLSFLIPARQFNDGLILDVLTGRDTLGFKILFLQIIMLILLFAYKKIKDDKYRVILLISIIGIIMENAFSNAGLLKRLGIYGTIFLLLGVPVAVRYTFNKCDRIVVTYLLYGCNVALFVNALLGGTNGILPYSTIFN